MRMSNWLLLLACLVGNLGLSACNTMAGLGQDVKSAGDAIERGAKK